MKIAFVFSFTLLAIHSSLAFSLDEDRNQLIRIQSDRAVVDDKNGISTYMGNVTVDQGSLHISADKVKVFSESNEVSRITASVDPTSDYLAHFEQKPDTEPLVVAEAKKIVYFVREEKLRLTGTATLTQANDRSFASETIDYDVKAGLVNAESEGDQRVRTIFTPQKK